MSNWGTSHCFSYFPTPPTSHNGSLPTASQPVPYVSQHQSRTFYSDVIIDQEPVTELIASNQPESSRISSSTVDYSCLHNPSPVSHPSQPHAGSSSQGRKRNDRSEAEEKREKKKRMCMKCRIQGCPGVSARKYCKAACQDCKLDECQGRNSQYADLLCDQGWKKYHKKIKSWGHSRLKQALTSHLNGVEGCTGPVHCCCT